ncbi:hypothetical protein [Pseudorhodobacter sp.]|uniref:hypothetical protein n=1 Tax=Pseudorhodobacter sp. TaxID=1934400 RepID=UPI002AFF6A77|nr:hypothetical protein [Pseudorhodobacter sp.]
MTASSLNIALVLRADVGAAKAGLTDVTSGLKQLSSEAVAAGAGTAKQAAELERMASADRKSHGGPGWSNRR